MIYGHLENSRLIELKACPFRVDVTSLSIPVEVHDQYGIHSPEGSDIQIFEGQKFKKRYTAMITHTNNAITQYRFGYKLANPSEELPESQK